MKISIIFSLIVLTFCFSQNSFSQNSNSSKYDSALLTKYTEKELNEMAKSNPDELAFLNAFVKTGFYITDFPQGKEGATEINGARKIENINDVNFFKLNIDIKENDYQYFTILGTNKLLVVKSKAMVLKEMNK
jgi:hypothetical protein